MTQIETASLQAQTQIIANGLESATALEFLSNLPAVETMMPALDILQIQAKFAERARRSHGYPSLSLVE